MLTYGKLSTAIMLAILAPALVTGVCAQQPPPAGSGSQDGGSKTSDTGASIDDKLVSVDAEMSRLVDVLPDLMKTVGADYALDSAVKNARVTIHITHAKFKVTLDAMMKASDTAVAYRVEKGLYHFMAAADAPPPPPSAHSRDSLLPSTRRGPLYNGGDPFAVAVSELFQFLAGSEPAMAGKSPYPDGGSYKAGSGSLSGSRNFSEYGFINGKFSSSSYSTPDISNPYISTFGGGYGYFTPLGRGNGVVR